MLNKVASDPRQRIPSVEKVLQLDGAKELLELYGQTQVTFAIRRVLNQLRTELSEDKLHLLSLENIVSECQKWLKVQQTSSLKGVLNLTGTVLHTNLGRAVIAPKARDAALKVMSSPVNIEYDTVQGERGERDDHVEHLICQLTGAQAATFVNNNAAAVLLALNTFAIGKQVVVSRGELVEIGGSFRIPDIIARAGCELFEVGTTNRTHKKDFDLAINPSTAALLKVHTSNYSIEGFTAEVSLHAMAQIANSHHVPFIADLGSGTLINLEEFGLSHELTVRETIEAGADLVTFSGDKLLGGPQCGIIAGKKEYIQRIKSNPLKRALRFDKIILSILESTLRLYQHPEKLAHELPTLRYLLRSQDEIEQLALRIFPTLQDLLKKDFNVSVASCHSQVGSGSLPVDRLPSMGFQITPIHPQFSATKLAAMFRNLPVPMIGRLHKSDLWLDLRCLENENDFLEQLQHLKMPL